MALHARPWLLALLALGALIALARRRRPAPAPPGRWAPVDD